MNGVENVTNLRKQYGEGVNAIGAKLMKLFRLDRVYDQAQGIWLYCTDSSGKELKVLDFLGGYGALLLGHNPPELIRAYERLFKESRPQFIQLSIPSGVTELSIHLRRKMLEITGLDYRVGFANSGAEAVEAVLKHTRMRKLAKIKQFEAEFERAIIPILKRTPIEEQDYRKQLLAEVALKNQQVLREFPLEPMALSGAYHGKTSGALCLMSNPKFRVPFLGDKGIFMCKDDPEALDRVMRSGNYELQFPRLDMDDQLILESRQFNRFTAFFVEPIQGEGGVRPIDPTWLTELRISCDNYNLKLVFDEIQSGCYRTGNFLASETFGINADYYLLGKALGGGLVKIAAYMTRENLMDDHFSLLHSSTYAEGGHAGTIALKAMELSEERVPQIQKRSKYLRESLNALSSKYPNIIHEVRGRGLMVGVEFKSFRESESYGFQLLDRTDFLHYFYVGFLLNNWGIRVAAPLSARNTLRIQPPVCVSNSDIDHLISALDALCHILLHEDLYKLIEYLLPIAYRGLRKEVEDFRQGTIQRVAAKPGVRRVGFITHFIDATTIRAADPSLAILDTECLEYLLDRLIPITQPIISGSRHIMDAQGQEVHLTLSGMCVTSSMCRQALGNGKIDELQALCHQTVDILADEENCELIGLGQYSSILTRNGTSIPRSDLGITTGNSYTVWLGLEAIEEYVELRKGKALINTVGIVGAAGNIAKVYTQYFADHAQEILLLGSNSRTGYQKALRTATNLLYNCCVQILAHPGVKHQGFKGWLQVSPVLKGINSKTSLPKAPALFRQFEQYYGEEMPLRVVKSIEELNYCEVVVTATNSAEAFLTPEHFQPGTLVVDISVPLDCTKALLENTKEVEVILGGIAQLPKEEVLPIKGFPLERGQTFGCLGETLLLGLSGEVSSFSFGSIYLDDAIAAGEFARRHGFKLGKSKKEIIF